MNGLCARTARGVSVAGYSEEAFPRLQGRAEIAGGAVNRDVDVPVLLAELRRRGCVVDKAALPVVRPRVDPATGDSPKDRSVEDTRPAERAGCGGWAKNRNGLN